VLPVVTGFNGATADGRPTLRLQQSVDGRPLRVAAPRDIQRIKREAPAIAADPRFSDRFPRAWLGGRKMLIADVLRSKGHDVVKISPADSVALAVRKLAEHRIGALVVENQWTKLIGIFSERDFVNAIARHGAAMAYFAGAGDGGCGCGDAGPAVPAVEGEALAAAAACGCTPGLIQQA